MRGQLFASVVALFFAGSAHALPITACGQTVPTGETAELMNDLICMDRYGVTLEDGATLNLNGFSITGPGSGGVGVLCDSGGCAVSGPGDISHFDSGIFGTPDVQVLNVKDVRLRNNEYGIHAAYNGVKVTNVVADDNEGWGILVDRLRGTGIQANNNGEGGVGANKFTLVGLTASGNGREGGLIYGAGSLIRSTVTGNDGLGQGYDVISQKRVRLRNTVCGKSARLDKLDPTKVVGSFGCAND